MIVAIDGFGASGKTSLALHLAREFHGHVVSLDDFTRPGTPTWEHERFIDELVHPLRAGREATYRRWRYDMDSPTHMPVIPAGSLVIVEGVSALALEVVERIGTWWDLSLWVDVPEHVRRERIRSRDGDALLPVWEKEWWPSEEHYFRTQSPKHRADFIAVPHDHL